MALQHSHSGKRRSRFAVGVLASVLILTTLTAWISSLFVSQIRNRVRSTTVQVISELTGNKVRILSGLLEEARTDTKILASTLMAEQDSAQHKVLLDAFQKNHHNERIALLDKQGNYLYGSEKTLALNGIPKEFAAEVAEQGEAMSDAVPGVNGQRYILFGALIPSGGRIYIALSTNDLQNACGAGTFRDEGYSYVVGRDGSIIIPPVRFSYEQIYGNMELLLGEMGNDKEALAEFMDALAGGKTGSIVMNFEDQAQLLCFEPINTEKDWQFVTVVPIAAVEADGTQIIKTAVIMAVIIVGVLVLALLISTFLYSMIQRKQRENDRFLRSVYQAISQNTDTVIFILDDLTSRPDYIFENSERILGIPCCEFLDEEQGENSAFKSAVFDLLRNQRPECGKEQEIYLYNDRMQKDMWLKVLICPFLLRNKPKHIFAVTDVTEERQARENIAAAVIAAEQANSAKSSFLANMSHDMRTPMNGIVGMIAIARRNIGDTDKVLDCLDKVDLSSSHLLSLINDVLDMSKIESGKLVLAMEPFDMKWLMQRLEIMIRPQCEAREQTLNVTMELRHKSLIGDTVRLTQILMNLLSNAVKFTPEGGMVALKVQELDQKHMNYASYRFTVSDTGIGMSPEFLKVIFNPFERAQDMTVNKAEGTGLGMPITKNLVAAMGGQITVESKSNQGSVFKVELELPMQEAGQIERTPDNRLSAEVFDFTGRRFLLAEDNLINREIAVENLRGFGAEVEPVENGQQALELFVQSVPGYYDAVLLDIQMPVMDGHETARQIRKSAHPQAKSIAILAMTANAFEEDINAAMEAGMNAHISKPIDMELLNRTLGRYVNENGHHFS